MFQEFFLKKMLQSKGVSADQIDFFLDLIKKTEKRQKKEKAKKAEAKS